MLAETGLRKELFPFDSDPQNDASNKNNTRVNNCLATRSGLLSLSIHGLPHLTTPGSADILCALVGFCPQTADEQKAAGKLKSRLNSRFIHPVNVQLRTNRGPQEKLN